MCLSISSFCVTTSAARTFLVCWGLDVSWEVQARILEHTPLSSLWSSPQDLVLPVDPATGCHCWFPSPAWFPPRTLRFYPAVSKCTLFIPMWSSRCLLQTLWASGRWNGVIKYPPSLFLYNCARSKTFMFLLVSSSRRRVGWRLACCIFYSPRRMESFGREQKAKLQNTSKVLAV